MEILKKVVLWTYKQPVNGEYEIRIRLTLHKEQKYFNVGHSCSLENWDEVAGAPAPGSPNYRAITRKIEDFLDEVDFEIKLMKKNGHEYISLSELISRVKKYAQPVVAAKIYALSEHIENELRAADKIGYADTFRNNREYVLKKVFGEKDRSFVSFNKADFSLQNCQ